MTPNVHKLAKHDNQLGSMGLAGDRETAGGGRIVLIAKSLLMQNYGAGL